MEIVQELEQGKHIVRALEAPIYSVCSSNDAEQQFFLKKLGAGEKTCVTSLAATPQFF
jgi:hypothetical protein